MKSAKPARTSAKPTRAKKASPAGRTPAARKKPVKAPATRPAPSTRLLGLVVRALDAKKAEHLQVLDVSHVSSITDFLVIATANSDPHLRALRIELEKVLDAEKAKILGMETGPESGWTVVDAFDVMVHLLTAANRDKYRLELLWNDAKKLDISSLLS